MFPFEKLEVWKKAIDFNDEVLSLADSIGKKDQYSLGEQIRRASISITNNIAEGGGRSSKKEKAYFYNMARGSVYEVVNLLEICGRKGYLDKDKHAKLYKEAEEISKMLSGLIGSME